MSNTLHEEIADVLAEEILRGQYRPGERLPSERDLASRFQANRGAVREAVKKLEQLRLTDVQPGGSRVRAVEDSSLGVLGYLLSMNEVADPSLVEQMMDVINALVTLAAQQAVVNASDREVAEAHNLIERILSPDTPLDELLQSRMDLGQTIMRISHNLVLTLIGRSLHIQIMGKKGKVESSMESREELDRGRPYLRQLDDCLHRRDSEGAVAALKKLTQLNKETVLPALQAAHELLFGERRAAI